MAKADENKEKISKLKLKLGELQYESMGLATEFQTIQNQLKKIRTEMVATAQAIIKAES